MNQRQKELYLREYALLKAQGKPFFPYAVAKDSVMACVVLLASITMSIVFGAELGPKADPTTTTYVPRPEWYFFFLFEVLRVIKPAILTPVATIGVPTICIILLILLPFVDRGPERRPERRPIATLAGIFTICAMGYLTYLGAAAGSPNEIEYKVPQQFEAGKLAVAQSGCLACHKIGENGNTLGPSLTDVGSRLGKDAIARTWPSSKVPVRASMAERCYSPWSCERKSTIAVFFSSGSPAKDGIGAVGFSSVRRIAAFGSFSPMSVRSGPGPSLPLCPILWHARQPDCAVMSLPSSYCSATSYSIELGDPAAAPR